MCNTDFIVLTYSHFHEFSVEGSNRSDNTLVVCVSLSVCLSVCLSVSVEPYAQIAWPILVKLYESINWILLCVRFLAH